MRRRMSPASALKERRTPATVSAGEPIFRDLFSNSTYDIFAHLKLYSKGDFKDNTKDNTQDNTSSWLLLELVGFFRDSPPGTLFLRLSSRFEMANIASR